MRVLIVGAGIGGLSAAIALRRRGIEAVLFECTTELTEIGAGIAIAANAMKVLDSLGLADVVRHIGAEPRFYEIRSWRGEVLSRVSVVEQSEKVGTTSVAAHRADLQRALLQGLAEAGGEVHLGAEYVSFDQTEGYVRASFAGGREAARGRKDALLGVFGGWHEPIEELIRATDERAILRTAIYDRDPLGEHWGEGQVSLLGDAAHPMTPDLGQGACQAIEDAVVLAKCLSKESDPALAPRHYECHRTWRIATIVQRSRRLGRVAQLKNSLLCQLRDVLLKATLDRMLLRQTEEIVAYEG